MTLEIKEITRYFGEQKALDQVSFTLNSGELTGFLGPNGAGKSTLMKIITGVLPASSGEVIINGEKISAEGVAIRRQIGYLPENNPLYTDLYIAEYLEIAAGFYKLPRVRDRVREMMAMTGLEKESHKKIGALSKGYRQRVGLAQALLHDPPVLLLDEPTSGLDPNQLGEIRSLISHVAREKTVLLSSHILQEIEAMCKRVIIINQGKLVADSPIAQLRERSLLSVQKIYAEFDISPAPELLEKIPGIRQVVKEGKGWLFSALPGEDARPHLFRFAVNSGITLLALTEKQENLENIFQHLTGG
jgi:ABC-2 type transport system ATP-binding protein